MSFLDRWRARVMYTSEGIAVTGAGAQYRNEIRIRPECAGDAGLLAHEKIHVLQWQICIALTVLLCAGAGYLIAPVFDIAAGIFCAACSIPFAERVHGALYRKWPRYCLWTEVWAYRVQLRHYPDRTASIAAWIASKASGYHFEITAEQAYKELTS